MLIVTIFAVATVAAALGVGVLLGHYATEGECKELRSRIEALATALRNAAAGLNAAREENAGLAKRVAELTRHYLDQTDRVRVAEQQRSAAEQRAGIFESEVDLLKERGRQLAAEVAEQTVQILDMQNMLTAQLENLPIRFLKEASAELSKSPQKTQPQDNLLGDQGDYQHLA
jgi:chromosome segregation ATPase